MGSLSIINWLRIQITVFGLCNGLSESRTHKDSSSRHLANVLLHLWRSVLYVYGSRKVRTSNLIVKSYLLYHWAINPMCITWVSLIRTSIAHSQKMLTCLLVYHSILYLYPMPNQGIEPKFTIYKIVVLTVVLIRLIDMYIMICTGLEPVLPQWKSGVLTTCTSKSLLKGPLHILGNTNTFWLRHSTGVRRR